MKFLTDIRLLLIGIWLGAACFFIFVAQTAFSVLPEREMAGAIVNRTLAIVNYSGFAIGLILLAMTWIGSRGTNRFLVWTERFMVLLLTVACAVGQFVIAWWLVLLRQQMGKPIDQVAADDPLRIRFDELHDYSVWVLFAAMAAALIAFFIIANRKFTKPADKSIAEFDFQKEFKL